LGNARATPRGIPAFGFHDRIHKFLGRPFWTGFWSVLP
jgi:hypothetical protein